MCNCSNFVGETPYENKSLHAFNGAINSFDASTLDYTAAAGAAVNAGYNIATTPPATSSTGTKAKTDWLGTLLPIADSLFDIKRTPATDSGVQVDTNTPSTTPRDNSMTILIWVGGSIAVLIIAYFVVKHYKKK